MCNTITDCIYIDVDDFIVFSNATGIYQLPMNHDDDGSFTPQMLPLGQGEIHGVEYDNYSDELYWVQSLQPPGSDENTYSGSIRRGKLSGSDQVIVQDVTLVNAQWFDMQLDRTGGHVFWTLTHGSQIEVVNMNGKGLAPILSHTNTNPRSLAFNQNDRYVCVTTTHPSVLLRFPYFTSILYFVNWWGTTRFSTIQQLPLNANETEIVYQETATNNNLTASKEKQDSLFYDSDSRRLYWSDSKRQSILTCSIDSCIDTVRTVLNTGVHSKLGMVTLYS